MQVQIKIPGILATDRMGHQPKHYEWRNKHFLECSICGTRTGQYDTLQEAVEQWEAGNAAHIPARV